MFQDVVPFQVEEQQTLVQVVTLHGGRRIQFGQRILSLDLKTNSIKCNCNCNFTNSMKCNCNFGDCYLVILSIDLKTNSIKSNCNCNFTMCNIVGIA